MKLSIKSSVIVAAMLASLSSTTWASGSEGFSQSQNSDTSLYNAGKGVYADKFSCNTCPLAGKSLNAGVAKEVLGGSPKVQLSSDEQNAVTVYLKRRFKI